MQSSSFFTIVTVALIAVALIYQSSLLRRKKIWYFSLQQILTLVVLPGLIFPMLFSYLLKMMELPGQATRLIPDSLLVNEILLSTLFTYGGIAMHAVTKMLSELLANTNTEAERVNKFFHMTFSHNLSFAGATFAFLGMTLLELNHVPLTTSSSIVGGVSKGLIIGGSFALSVYNYTRYTSGDFGRWNDLKMTFAAVWIGFAILLYGIQRVDPRITEYQLLLPMLLSFSVMTVLSILLMVRRLKRGGWRVWIGKRRLQRYLTLEERA